MFDPSTLNQLLKDFGRTITLRKLAEGAYDSVTGTITKTPTDYSVRAYFYNDVPQTTEFTNISFGTKRAVISNKLTNGDDTPRPDVQDQVLYSEGDTTSITKVSPISSNNKTMCFLLHLDE